MPCAVSTSPAFVPSKKELAELRTIKFSLLLDQDREEMSKLLAAAEEVGFFYLDLTDDASRDLLETLDELKAVMVEWFAQPEATKKKTPVVTKSHGYKALGMHVGVGGQRDGWEALKIGKPELAARWALSPVVKQHLSQFDTFVSSSHFVLKVILSSLSSQLGSTGNDSLQNFHRDDLPSKSSAFFLHYPPRSGEENIGQNMHTDLGSLTLLFAAQWGLQVLCPSETQSLHTTEVQTSGSESMEWKFVEPRKGNAIINIGDALRFLTKCRLRSALHRVLPLYDTDRYSVTYFLRPSDDAKFVDSDGEACDAITWYLKKNSTYESSYQAQAKSSVLLGGIQNPSSIRNSLVA